MPNAMRPYAFRRWAQGVSCHKCNCQEGIKRGKDETQPHRQSSQCKGCSFNFDDLTDTIFTPSSLALTALVMGKASMLVMKVVMGFVKCMSTRWKDNGALLHSWLRPHRDISQEKLPLYLGFFEFVYNTRKRGKALLGAYLGFCLPNSLESRLSQAFNPVDLDQSYQQM